jgi:hypothetical protein
MIILKLKKRNRSFGIITWEYKQDFEVMTLFNKRDRIDYKFNKKIYNNRKVDYKYRRISFGKKRMKTLVDYDYISLIKTNNIIVIKPYVDKLQ